MNKTKLTVRKANCQSEPGSPSYCDSSSYHEEIQEDIHKKIQSAIFKDEHEKGDKSCEETTALGFFTKI